MARVLCLAALLHVCLAVALQLCGRWAVAPDWIEPDGNLARLTHDNYFYVRTLSGWVADPDSISWLGPVLRHAPVHLRLYVPLARGPAPLLLLAEPLNLSLYLLCVGLIYLLGRRLFSARAGVLAAAALAVWPSFVLHTLQLLKEPFFVAAYLGLIYALLCLLSDEVTPLRGAALGALSALLLAVLKLLRWEMWEVQQASLLVFGALLLWRQLWARRLWPGNTVAAVVLAAGLLSFPALSLRAPVLRNLAERPTAAQTVAAEAVAGPGRAPGWRDRVLARVLSLGTRARYLRRKAVLECQQAPLGPRHAPSCGAQVDGEGGVLGALRLGLWAPGPATWHQEGAQAGRAGRMLGGAEMLLLYAAQALALAALWRERRRVEVWWLGLAALLGCVALGLTVVNLGTLFRLRYGFFALVLVLAAGAPDVRLRPRRADSPPARTARTSAGRR